MVLCIIAASIWLYVLLGLLHELTSYMLNRKFRETVEETPLLYTLLYAIGGVPLSIICGIEAAKKMKREKEAKQRQETGQEE